MPPATTRSSFWAAPAGQGQRRRDLGRHRPQGTIDRHQGFHAVSDKEPGIKYLLDNQSGDWKQNKAYDIMTTALRKDEKIDLVYGHNDPMAYGATRRQGRGSREGHYVHPGIDGLPDEGVVWVHRANSRHLPLRDAGRRRLRQAIKLLKGEKIPPVITLPTMVIDKTNADEILKKNGLL